VYFMLELELELEAKSYYENTIKDIFRKGK
jgi:hypothetical protein